MNFSSSQTPAGRIDELDGLRGLLALWVALSHIFSWCGFANVPDTVSIPHRVKLLWTQFAYAPGAVDTFIILSGFVISYLLHSRPQSYRQFMIGRFFRIYPVYLICLLMGLAMIYWEPFVLRQAPWHGTEYFDWVRPVADSQLGNIWVHLLAHLTLFFGIIPDKCLPFGSVAFVAPAWSITLEWQYYLLAPLIARLFVRPGGLLFLGLVCGGEFYYLHIWGDSFLPAKLPLFLVGIGSFHLYCWARRQAALPYFKLVVAGALVGALTLCLPWISLGIWTLAFGSLLVSQAASNTEPAPDLLTKLLLSLKKLFLWPPLEWLGKISYPLYLIHWPLIIFLMTILLHWRPQIASFSALCIMLLVGLPIILLTAWLLHVSIEAPMMRWGRRFTK